ncbi:hypothetical protein, partial [Pseudomonas sp. NPDC089734]|uniref:hypothetical protein n=1 Tax=Pseudomonas sp. NPDC089734 TaxID=3364469 RepID=UPI0038162BF8
RQSFSIGMNLRISLTFSKKKTRTEAGLIKGQNLSACGVQLRVPSGCPQTQIAYRGAFVPPFGKEEKDLFGGGSSSTRLRPEFSHTSTIEADER